MDTQREYVLYESRGAKSTQQIMKVYTRPWTLKEVWQRKKDLEEENKWNRNSHFIPRVLRVPSDKQLLSWLSQCVGHSRAFVKKQYLVMGDLRGHEEGVDWIVGIYPTLKAAKERAGHIGRIVFLYHLERKELEIDQPPPITPDIWGLAQ